MKNTVMAVVSLVVGLGLMGCGDATGGGNGTRSKYDYKAISATGTLTLNAQLSGGCTATTSQSLTLGLGDNCSLRYTPSIGALSGRLDLTFAQQAPTGSNSCGSSYCDHHTWSGPMQTVIHPSVDLPDDPPVNTMVTPVLDEFNDTTLGDCNAQMDLPAALEAEQVTVGTFMTSEFTLTGSGQKNLTHSDLQGTTTGTLDYTFSIKFQLQPE